MNFTYPTELSPNNKKKEFQEEINTWKELLNSRIEGNIEMKNMLGNLLKKNYNQNFLQEIEEFQNNFIREDEVTDMLRNDVNKIDDLSYNEIFKGERMRDSWKKRLEKLRDDIIRTENHFCSLITSFEDFVCKAGK